MIKYLEILVDRLQTFFQKYSIKNPNQMFELRPLFSRDELVSCLQAPEDTDGFPLNVITLSSTFDVTGTNFYNTSSDEDIQPQLLSIEQICSLIDEELEIINENKIDSRLDSRGSFPTISKDDNFNTQMMKPWTAKFNSAHDYGVSRQPTTKPRKIKIIKKKKSAVY
ncbi:hypothetical protein Cantr_04159 [Candida viswanathii]|uniref:Uncharacterized protein n=1 Tax=Candida viswanathii TaxID=5486 RepID=A0A367XMD2_9ASCO|nr:hypothetical protein Cantr_04159 [Candida viswanathii]